MKGPFIPFLELACSSAHWLVRWFVIIFTKYNAITHLTYMSVLDVHCLRFILYLCAELVQLIKDKLSFVNILEEKPNLVVNKKVNANRIHWEKKHSLQNKFKQIHCGGTKIIQRQKEAWKSNIAMQSKA